VYVTDDPSSFVLSNTGPESSLALGEWHHAGESQTQSVVYNGRRKRSL
jgi:hypothetical protein